MVLSHWLLDKTSGGFYCGRPSQPTCFLPGPLPLDESVLPIWFATLRLFFPSRVGQDIIRLSDVTSERIVTVVGLESLNLPALGPQKHEFFFCFE